MTYALTTYPALIRPDDETGWVVVFPDFPDCRAAGNSIEIAVEFAQNVLAHHVHNMRALGEEVPKPSNPEKLMKKKRARGHILSFVPLRPIRGRAKRVNISLDEFLLKEIDAAAARHGTDRSNFLASAARARIAGR
jgi:predicted RNase H-like HicB family nuclease